MHTLLEVGRDALLHGIEGPGRVGDLGRAVFIQVDAVGIGVQCFHGPRQPRQWSDRDSHGQPGTADQQHQLAQQDNRQPWGDRHGGRPDVDRDRAAIGEPQLRLEVFLWARNIGEDQGVVAADGVLDRAHRDRYVVRGHGDAGLTLAQQVAIVAALKTLQPVCAFGGRQPVEDGDGGRNIVLQIAQHRRFRALVAFVELRAERQALGENQADQENQRKPRSQRAGPVQREGHDCAPRISTGKVNT
ncbi:hypothetical protein D9M68_780380 [compost metagenome]